MAPVRRLAATLTAAALLSLVSALPAAAQGGFGAIREWGTAGSGDGQFSNLIGDFVGPDGKVYVADGKNNRVQVFSPTGDFLLAFGSEGLGDGQFSLIENVAVSNSFILATDCYGGRLQQFTLDGKFVRSYGKYGSGADDFACPEDIAVAPNGHVFVLDTFNQRVKEFRWTGPFTARSSSIMQPQAPSLELVRTTGPGTLEHPFAIAFDAAGTLLVGEVDPHTCVGGRIREFASDGTFLKQWGTSGSGPGQLRCILSLAVDAANNVIVGDWSYVQAFTREGQFAAILATAGSGAGQFAGPLHIAPDASCNLYVTDRDNSRVQELGWSEAPFCRTLPAATPPPPPATPPPAGPVIVSTPALTLTAKVQRPLRTRAIELRATCIAPAACKLSVSFRMKLLHHVHFLRTRPKLALPARPVTLRATIPKKLLPALRRELAGGKRLRVSAYVSATSSGLGFTKAIGVRLAG